jgi:hypothetical protein
VKISKKYQKKFVTKIAQRLNSPAYSENEISLCESDKSRSLVFIRCHEPEDESSFVEAEVFFAVQVFDVPKLTEKYSGRIVDKDAFTCSLQLRNVAFPGHGLPDWNFELSIDDKESIERAARQIVEIAKSVLVPLAEQCRDIPGLIAAIKANEIPVHKFDFALLLALAGMFDQCKIHIDDTRSFFQDPRTGPSNPTIVLHMLDALALDVEARVGDGCPAFIGRPEVWLTRLVLAR